MVNSSSSACTVADTCQWAIWCCRTTWSSSTARSISGSKTVSCNLFKRVTRDLIAPMLCSATWWIIWMTYSTTCIMVNDCDVCPFSIISWFQLVLILSGSTGHKPSVLVWGQHYNDFGFLNIVGHWNLQKLKFHFLLSYFHVRSQPKYFSCLLARDRNYQLKWKTYFRRVHYCDPVTRFRIWSDFIDENRQVQTTHDSRSILLD